MMLYPSMEETRRLLEEYLIAPVFYEVLSDTCTPVRIFQALEHGQETCFILESVDNTQQWGRYSFIGINPKREIKIKDGAAVITELNGKGVSECEVENPIGFLSGILKQYQSPSVPNRPKFTGGLVGYFGYDTVRYFEKKLCHPPKDDLHMPDCHLFLYDEIVAYDHLSGKAVIILNVNRDRDLAEQYQECEARAEQLARQIQSDTVPEAQGRKGSGEMSITSNMTKEAYMANVEKAKQAIRAGDIFQVVPSQRFEIENPPDPFQVYRMLRTSNPSPYLYYFKTNGYAIAGASPEMLVNVTKGIVTTKPIAGTIVRGADEASDKQNEKILIQDPKERAEHTMLVDLGRNDLGRVCKFGTVEVTRFMQVERYSKVMHLVSDVKGILNEDQTALDALMSALPAGTLSGAPKIRAMEIIDELEPVRRGLYGGTVGYLGFDGNLDTCIAIRTVLYRNGKAYVQAGGGVVADSDPEKEYLESCNKAQTVMSALEAAKAAEH